LPKTQRQLRSLCFSSHGYVQLACAMCTAVTLKAYFGPRSHECDFYLYPYSHLVGSGLGNLCPIRDADLPNKLLVQPPPLRSSQTFDRKQLYSSRSHYAIRLRRIRSFETTICEQLKFGCVATRLGSGTLGSGNRVSCEKCRSSPARLSSRN
jgi:hypothetical protein